MNKTVKWIAGVLALVLIIAGAYFLYNKLTAGYTPGLETNEATEQGESGETSQPDNPAPDFRVFDKDGNEVTLESMRGKPVVINFWATWCGYCKKEMPDFQTMYEKYGDDVHFMMVNATDNVQETVKSASKYIENEGFTFPVYFDTSGSAVNAYRLTGFPATFFIDKDGNLITGARGMLDGATLEKGINMILD